MNWIISFLEWNNIEDVVKKFLSASCAHCKSLQILFIIYSRLYTRYRLNQAFHESYELDHFPVDLHHLATNNEAPMMSYIASVLLVLTADSMRVERLVSLYNDVKILTRGSGLPKSLRRDLITSHGVDKHENFRLNPLECKGNYSTTSNKMKLVHWPFMGGLLHMVQRGGDWAGPQPAQVPPRCTKCNSPPISGQSANFILFDVVL